MNSPQNQSRVAFQSKRLRFELLDESHITDEYISWLNDPQTNRFLESVREVQTQESVANWICKTHSDPHRAAYGIYLRESHIGNLTFYMIDHLHLVLRIGIMIGSHQHQNQGFGREAISAAADYVFNTMGFNRIEAAMNLKNQHSIRTFRAAGFIQEAVFRQRLHFEGEFLDAALMALLREEWAPN